MIEEPGFLKDLHRIRRKLSKITIEEYDVRQEKTMELFRKELGDLYVKK